MKYILPEQKNTIFNLCRELGVMTGNFSFKHIPTYNSELYGKVAADSIEWQMNNYSFYFRIAKEGDTYLAELFPGIEEPKESHELDDWESVAKLLKPWLSRVKTNQVDYFELYKDISKNIPLLTIRSEFDSSLFSEEETKNINQRLDEFEKEIVSELSLTKEEIVLLRKEVEFLKSQTKKQNRRDYGTMFQNALVTIIANYASDPDKFNKILGIIKNIFSGALNLLPGA